MQVFLNGKFVSEKSAKVSIFDSGFMAGEGLFETLLVKRGELQFFAEHLSRLKKGAKFLKIKIPFSFKKIKGVAEKLIKKNKLAWSMLRITITCQTFLIIMKRIPKRPREASACFVHMERCLPNIKSLNYLPSVLAQCEAIKKGFDEALLVDRDGYVTEGGQTNFFWIKKGKVFTPPLNCALGGITREKVIQLIKKLGLKFAEKRVRQKDLLEADEVFLTNAPMEIWPVKKVENKKKRVGDITQKIQESYHKSYS